MVKDFGIYFIHLVILTKKKFYMYTWFYIKKKNPLTNNNDKITSISFKRDSKSIWIELYNPLMYLYDV